MSKLRFLVTGGNFIGSHIAKKLFKSGHYARIAGIRPSSYFNECISNEVRVGNLCNPSFCASVVRSMDTVLHFAATMGGMGAIHEGNDGSDRSVTIENLAKIAINSVGMETEDVLLKSTGGSRPIGVHARNSNNEFVTKTLGWSPKVTLEDGMMKTAEWIGGEMKNMPDGKDQAMQNALLHSFKTSELVDLNVKRSVSFAILLPITSRGLDAPEKSLDKLRLFAQSLVRTTWRDTHVLGDVRFRVKIYLGIDADDEYLQRSTGNGEQLNITESVLSTEGIVDFSTEICDVPRGHVCTIWRKCANRAWEDGADYFVLMGDDAVLLDEGWMRDVHEQFVTIAQHERVPHGLGCVAFTDVTFPGMPTFPVIHRTHMTIFEGQVIPDTFINQDGDPFLFQLYRKWGCSRMISSRISNGVGGGLPARYTQQHADGWTFGPLENAASAVEAWLVKTSPAAARKMTLDIVIPCYRVLLPFLGPILALQPSPTCEVMFIIIIDDPNSPNITKLEATYAHRPDVRIRINTSNLGASASRNRGLKESAADWVLFLDDDVTPQADILVEAEKVIRSHPHAAGFIGNTLFPVASTVFTNAVHLAGMTHFWDIATKMSQNESDMPWGVSANLIARRAQDGVEFDLQFPKTGGGEDIDYCRKKRDFSVAHGGEGFYPAPDVVVTHPWWNQGRRSYWRFYMWSKGDGGLIKLYPDLTYLDHTPNSAEMFLISMPLSISGVFTYLFTNNPIMLNIAVSLAMATVFANIVHDMYRHLWRDVDRTKAFKSSLNGPGWAIAVVESALIRMASEGGRVIGLLERGEILYLGRRFDWFTGRAGDGPMKKERKNGRQRMALVVLFAGIVYSVLSSLIRL